MSDCIGKHSPWESCPDCERYDDSFVVPRPRAHVDRTGDYIFAGLMALLIVAIFATVIVWIVVASV